MMRALVIVLAVLAAAKLWTQQRLYREGAEEALILAYRERAVAACQSQDPIRLAAAGAAAPLWTQAATVSLAIGRQSADANIWQLDNPLWPARYKHPHLVLTASGDSQRAVCEYDVMEGRAYLR